MDVSPVNLGEIDSHHAGLYASRGDPPVRRARRDWSRRLSPLLLPGLLAGIVLLPLALLASAAWITWRQFDAEARADAAHLAGTAAEFTRRALDGHAQAAQRVVALLHGLPDDDIRAREAELHAALRTMIGETPEVDTAYVVDRNGRPLLSANIYPVPHDITFADREYHQLLAAPGAPPVVVTRVYRGRIEANLFFAVARRRGVTGNHDVPPGAYDGQANVAIDPRVLAEGLRRIRGSEDDVLSVVRRDGEILASTRMTDDNAVPGRIPADTALIRAVAQGRSGWTRLSPSPVDGVLRYGSFRAVDNWPVFVTAARPQAAVVERWRRAMLAPLAIGLTATAALFGLALLVWRSQRRLAASHALLEARVADRTAELAESEARLRRVQQIGRVGGFEIDLRTGENLRTAEYMRLQGKLSVETMERHADWVRRLHPEDRKRAEAAFWNAVSDESGHTRYAQDYRILTPQGETRWIAARAEIERGRDGQALRMVGAHMDVTELKAAQAAIADSTARLRAAVQGAKLGIWERNLADGTGWWDARTATIFGGLPSDQVADRAAFLGRIHPDDRLAYRTAVTAVVAPDGPDHYEAEFRLRRPDGGWTWVLSHGAVVERDAESGRAMRLAGIVKDITERRVAESQRARLLYEVDHRARNALALVVAILRLTPRDNPARYAASVEGRVTALARLHAALAERSWEEAEFRAVVEAGMAGLLAAPAGAAGRSRLRLSGPSVTLPPAAAQALCMALHELTANALLHGAFAAPQGQVALSWESAPDGALTLDWQESGVAAPRPSATGFGLALVETTVRHQLDGRVTFTWDTGFACRIEIPPHAIGAAGVWGEAEAVSPSEAEAAP